MSNRMSKQRDYRKKIKLFYVAYKNLLEEKRADFIEYEKYKDLQYNILDQCLNIIKI